MSLKEYSFDPLVKFKELYKERYYTIPNHWHLYMLKFKFKNQPLEDHIMVRIGFYPSYVPKDFFYGSLVMGELPRVSIEELSSYAHLYGTN